LATKSQFRAITSLLKATVTKSSAPIRSFRDSTTQSMELSIQSKATPTQFKDLPTLTKDPITTLPVIKTHLKEIPIIFKAKTKKSLELTIN
jgi:hypothetical protein